MGRLIRVSWLYMSLKPDRVDPRPLAVRLPR